MADRQVPSDNMHCPMCMDVLAHAVTTSCGHTFCGKCIITYWESNDASQPVPCPLDRTKVSMLITNFVVRNEINRIMPERQNQVVNCDDKIQEYNNKFANIPRNVGAQIREDVFLLRHLSNAKPLMKLLFYAVIIFAVSYVFLPFDLIPDEMGLIGIFDDLMILAFAVIFFYAVAENYRQSLVNRRQ